MVRRNDVASQSSLVTLHLRSATLVVLFRLFFSLWYDACSYDKTSQYESMAVMNAKLCTAWMMRTLSLLFALVSCCILNQYEFLTYAFFLRHHHNQGTWNCHAISRTESNGSWVDGHDPRGSYYFSSTGQVIHRFLVLTNANSPLDRRRRQRNNRFPRVPYDDGTKDEGYWFWRRDPRR